MSPPSADGRRVWVKTGVTDGRRQDLLDWMERSGLLPSVKDIASGRRCTSTAVWRRRLASAGRTDRPDRRGRDESGQWASLRAAEQSVAGYGPAGRRSIASSVPASGASSCPSPSWPARPARHRATRSRSKVDVTLDRAQGRAAAPRAAADRGAAARRPGRDARAEPVDGGLRDGESRPARAYLDDQLRREVDLPSREHREFRVSITLDPLPAQAQALRLVGAHRIPRKR